MKYYSYLQATVNHDILNIIVYVSNCRVWPENVEGQTINLLGHIDMIF